MSKCLFYFVFIFLINCEKVRGPTSELHSMLVCLKARQLPHWDCQWKESYWAVNRPTSSRWLNFQSKWNLCMFFCLAHPLFVLLWSIDSSFFGGAFQILCSYLLFHQTPKCNESGFSLLKEDNPNLVFTEEKNWDVHKEWSSLLKSPAVTPCQLSNRCPFPLADCWWKKGIWKMPLCFRRWILPVPEWNDVCHY